MAETAADIEAELVELRAARKQLALGQRIKEVWRSGRRIVYEGITLTQLDSLISQRECDLAAAECVAAGGRRRRPMRMGWPN
jgi:gpW